MTKTRAATGNGTHVSSATLGVLAALMAYAPLSIDMVLPGLPAALADLGASSASFRMVTSATFVGLGVGQAIGGPLSDRVGRRRPSIGSALAFAIAALGCATAQSMLWLQVASLLMGAAAAVGVVASRASIRDCAADDNAAHLLSRIWAFAGFVPVTAPLAGALILNSGGWRLTYEMQAAYGLVFAAVMFFKFEETMLIESRHEGSHRDTLRVGVALLRDRRFLSYAGTLTGGYVAFIGYVSAAPFIFQRTHGWTPSQFSALYSLNALAGVLATHWNTRRVMRIGAHEMLMLGLRMVAVAATIIIAGGLLHSVWVVAAGCMLIVAAWGPTMNNNIALAMSSQSVASGTASAVLGIVSFGVGGVVSALVGAAGGVSPVTTGIIMLAGVGISGLFIWLVHTHDVSSELSS